MPFDESTQYFNMPKEGQESINITIEKIEKVQSTDKLAKFNFRTWAKGDLGYHYLITLKDGKTFRLGNWSLLIAMQKENIKEGDTFKIKHISKGKWEIVKE